MPSPFGFSTDCDEVAKAFADRIKGRTFLVTGTTAGGLGANTVLTLARQGPAHVILVSRTRAKTEPVLAELAREAPGVKATFVACELSDLDSVRAAADAINKDADIGAIDVVINNAGVMAIPYRTDKLGRELTLSSNHLGHFLLTNLILPKVLAAGPGARVVNLSSNGHRISNFRFDDPGFSGGKAYEKWTAYGQSKTANVLFSVALAERLGGTRGVFAFSVHPGGIFDTALSAHLDVAEFEVVKAVAECNNWPGVFTLDPPKTLAQGTSPIVAAALDPELEARNGAFIDDCQLGRAEAYALDSEAARRLWALSEEMVGEKFDW
ncbi:hypothetical protein RB598_008402 [Gaeumannomyces tritici]